MRVRQISRFVFAVVWGVATIASAPVLAAVTARAEGGVTLDRHLTDSAIAESSGLAASARFPGVLYTHNDSGDNPVVYAVDQRGVTVARLTLAGVKARDWEAIAISDATTNDSTLWVGDIGDNRGVRTKGIMVHRISEPTSLRSTTIRPTSYRLRFPDGAQDAEALLVHPQTGRLYIFTKEAFGGSLYEAPDELSTTTANMLQPKSVSFSIPNAITDATFLPDGRLAILNHFHKLTVVDSFLKERPRVRSTALDFPAVNGQAAQTESIAASSDGRWLYVGSEGEKSPVVKVRVDQVAPSRADNNPDASPASTETTNAAPGNNELAREAGKELREMTTEWASPQMWAGAGIIVLAGTLIALIITLRKNRR